MLEQSAEPSGPSTTSELFRASGLRLLVGGASAVVLIAGIRAAAPVLNTFLLAGLIAVTLMPGVSWLIRKGLPRGLAVLVTTLVVVVGGLGLIGLVASAVARLLGRLPVYEARLRQLWEAQERFLAEYGIILSDYLSVDTIGPGRLVSFAGSLVGATGGALGNSLILLLVVVLMMLEITLLEARLEKGHYPPGSIALRWRAITQPIQNVISITGLTGLAAAAANLILFLVMGVDYAVVWAVLSFFANFVPYIGLAIAAAPPVLLALLESGWVGAVVILGGVLVINAVIDNIVKPLFLNQGIGVSPLAVIASLIFWSWALGAPGAVLAVPLTIALRDLARGYVLTAPGRQP